MAAPHVYAAISGLMADLSKAGVAKNHRNERDDYRYRSIDDIMDRLSPLLASHRVCVLPRVLERTVLERSDDAERLVLNVTLRVMFTIVSADDGSSHVIEAFGEALDAGDKATSKAMSAAYKSAMIQTFCIPVSGAEDADETSYRLSARTHAPEPVQGWDQWVCDIAEIVRACESEAALDLVQERHRDLLKSVSRERGELYGELGRTFSTRREALRQPNRPRTPASKSRKATAKDDQAAIGLELQNG
jgi:hypothetical protein